ncbi:unnamed protein product [Lota lota]
MQEGWSMEAKARQGLCLTDDALLLESGELAKRREEQSIGWRSYGKWTRVCERLAPGPVHRALIPTERVKVQLQHSTGFEGGI